RLAAAGARAARLPRDEPPELRMRADRRRRQQCAAPAARFRTEIRAAVAAAKARIALAARASLRPRDFLHAAASRAVGVGALKVLACRKSAGGLLGLLRAREPNANLDAIVAK